MCGGAQLAWQFLCAALLCALREDCTLRSPGCVWAAKVVPAVTLTAEAQQQVRSLSRKGPLLPITRASIAATVV